MQKFDGGNGNLDKCKIDLVIWESFVVTKYSKCMKIAWRNKVIYILTTSPIYKNKYFLEKKMSLCGGT
jgi:hypothetical protein